MFLGSFRNHDFICWSAANRRENTPFLNLIIALVGLPFRKGFRKGWTFILGRRFVRSNHRVFLIVFFLGRHYHSLFCLAARRYICMLMGSIEVFNDFTAHHYIKLIASFDSFHHSSMGECLLWFLSLVNNRSPLPELTVDPWRWAGSLALITCLLCC